MKILLVSLIHNRRNFVGAAIQSAVSQSFPKDNWHHLLIDNASVDGADKVAEIFSKKYDNISLVRNKENLGQMPAYNWALNEWAPRDYPEAEIMVHLDSDDLLSPDALFEVNRKFEEIPCLGQIYSDFNIIDSVGNIKTKSHPKARQLPPNVELTERGQDVLRKWEIMFNVIGHIRAMRISALREIGGFDEEFLYATDVNMACKMLSSRFKVAKIPKPLYFWREHGKSQVQGEKSKEQTMCWQKICEKYKRLWNIK